VEVGILVKAKGRKKIYWRDPQGLSVQAANPDHLKAGNFNCSRFAGKLNAAFAVSSFGEGRRPANQAGRRPPGYLRIFNYDFRKRRRRAMAIKPPANKASVAGSGVLETDAAGSNEATV